VYSDGLDTFWNSELVSELLNEINVNRWYSYVEKLSSFNRYAEGDGIKEAREWIVGTLKEINGLQVTTQEFTKGGHTFGNIIGTLSGTEQSENKIIIGGHYDSISEFPQIAAPGAVDNATGTAAVIEIAHVLVKRRPRVTVCFVLFDAEELGHYYGSKVHVESLTSTSHIKMMLNLDMIGWTNPKSNYMEIETINQFSNLARVFRRAADRFCSLPSILSWDAWGSDHVTYLRKDIPAILTTNFNCINYPHYHTTKDTKENVSVDTALNFLRMDIASLAQFVYNGVDPKSLEKC